MLNTSRTCYTCSHAVRPIVEYVDRNGLHLMLECVIDCKCPDCKHLVAYNGVERTHLEAQLDYRLVADGQVAIDILRSRIERFNCDVGRTCECYQQI